ncbi:MAG: zinc ribbon domain-containing protein [Lachnospiraceae bacterium]|nr:zinc ribbon domain-containing protein [Lachnospiraceae bacterium]
MSKFCLKCGNELDDNAKFCNVCGAAVENTETSKEGTDTVSTSGINTEELMQKASDTAQKTVKAVNDTANRVVDSIPDDIKAKVGGAGKTKIILFAGVAVVALLVVCLLVSAMSSGPKKAVKKQIKAMYSADAKDYVKTVHPDMVEYYEDEWGRDFDEYVDAVLESAEDEYGDDIKVKKFKVESSKKLSKDKCEDYEEELEDYYDLDISIKAVYKVKGTFTIKGDDDDEDMEFKAYVIKSKGKYYVYSIDIEED